MNQEIAKIFRQIAELLEIKGDRAKASQFKIKAYQKAALALENLPQDISQIYRESGLKGLEKLRDIGKGTALKIEEYLQKGKIKYYDELAEETAIQQIVAYFFASKGLDLADLKQSARRKEIVYSRYTKPAKQLLELAGSLEKAKQAIDKVAQWANSRDLDYAIETIFKKWLELDRLKPKEVVKKPFYEGQPMVWSQAKKKWFVINDSGEWLEYADKESKIEWRIVK
ncbi:MAG: helix-hairpin-helix domain-containing protein [Candidatus Pacebacteria bacterium]|nr:helix-hairpin-helix domain-containing protein [Candidatus Paceibacterota bacterium]